VIHEHGRFGDHIQHFLEIGDINVPNIRMLWMRLAVTQVRPCLHALLSHVAGVKQSFETVFHAHIVELAKQTFETALIMVAFVCFSSGFSSVLTRLETASTATQIAVAHVSTECALASHALFK
jgi:hypothetical protein